MPWYSVRIFFFLFVFNDVLSYAGSIAWQGHTRVSFMSSSQISPEKVGAYHATSFRLGDTGADIILKIGILSPPVIALFRTRQVACGAFVTAFNPYGVQQSDAENERAHARLLNQVASMGLPFMEGSGGEDGFDWPAERSLFVLGLVLPDAEKLGQLFEQDAIVWVGADGTPQLILLR